MRTLAFVCLLIGSIFTFGFETTSAFAAERCATRSFQAEFEGSAAVFVGEVVKVREVVNKKYFTFRVEKYWKGVRSEEVTLLVYENPRFQAPYEEGKTFLVFAKRDDDDVLFDSRCSRSALIDGTSSSLKDDLEQLGDAKTCIDLSEKEGKAIENENH